MIAGGKSLTVLLPAVRESTVGMPGCTLLVLPFAALISQFEHTFSQGRSAVPFWTYRPSASVVVLDQLSPPPTVVLMSVEHAHEHGEFARFLQVNRNFFRRAVLDEIHVLVTQSNFRKQMERLKVLAKSGIKLVGLSATMPDGLFGAILKALDMSSDDWTVIKAPRTIRPNIRFEVQHEQSEFAAIRSLIDLIKSVALASSSGPRARILVFTTTCAGADEVAHALSDSLRSETIALVEKFHGKMSEVERKQAFDSFVAESQNRVVLVGTTGFGTGIDVGGVRLVVIFGGTHSVIELAQQSGRCGRDGLPAQCRWIQWTSSCQDLRGLHGGHTAVSWDPFSAIESFCCTTEHATCRRSVLSLNMDQLRETCIELQAIYSQAAVQLCDVCGTYTF